MVKPGGWTGQGKLHTGFRSEGNSSIVIRVLSEQTEGTGDLKHEVKSDMKDEIKSKETRGNNFFQLFLQKLFKDRNPKPYSTLDFLVVSL